MKSIEQNLKDLCRLKGLSLTDVANRMGTSPSNLLSSVKGNPTVSKIQDIADALNVSISELLTAKPEKSLGLAIIGGHTYQLAEPSVATVQLPHYTNYDALRKDITAFVKAAVKQDRYASLMGMLEAFEVFSLVYDHARAQFLLSVCYGAGETFVTCYDKVEYAFWGPNDTEETIKWNLPDITQEIINDVEGSALTKLQSR